MSLIQFYHIISKLTRIKMDIEEKRRMRKATQYDRFLNRQKTKQQSTVDYGKICVREAARVDTWSTPHHSCFRCTIGPGETDEHIQLKFNEWLKLRRAGATVYCELIWKNGKKSDLVACWPNGEVEIIEIAVTESDESLKDKENYYPFPIRVVRGEK